MTSPDRAPQQPPVEEMPRFRRTRRPKYPVFIGLGVLVGVVAAGLFVLLVPVDPAEAADPEYSLGKVLAYTSLVLALVGGLLGGLVAVLLDRRR